MSLDRERKESIMNKTDQLFELASGACKIEGYLGQRLDACIGNGVMAADYDLYVAPFRDRSDDAGGGNNWMGEFWGKWFTSAALAYRYRPEPAYRKILDDAVEKLLQAQTPDGRLSTYRQDFGEWDIWGRKYALLGLVSYYEQTGSKNALEAACRAADALIAVAGPGRKKLTETGLTLLDGLSSCSVLEPIVDIYKFSGEKRYLDFAEYLVSLWSEPNSYTDTGLRLIEGALEGKHPMEIAAPKGYEMTSCYEGICELYRVTGKEKYLRAAIRFGELVKEKEIMLVGSGSSAELWCDGIKRQTEMIEQPMETCVTATWMKYCYQLLRLTGESRWADEIELTLYNALLAALMPQGDWWAYFTPLIGERMPSPVQVPQVKSSCCVVNGPRALLLTPNASVMRNEEGAVVNLYAQGEWHFQINDTPVVLRQDTEYPKGDQIRITLSQPQSAEYAVSLRIPGWSRENRLLVNGEAIECTPGSYCVIRREWKDGDCIEYRPDMRGRVIAAPAAPNQKAVLRGPVVLALDSRLEEERPQNVYLEHAGYHWKHDKGWNIDYMLFDQLSAEETEYIELIPCTDEDGIWMTFEVPFIHRPYHFLQHKRVHLKMCDYASAGNCYSDDNLFRVWLNQPLYLNAAYPKETWRLLANDRGLRPEK